MNDFRKQPKKFDDAVPERFLNTTQKEDIRRLKVNMGEAVLSPYIVKLSRDERPIPEPTSVTAEIEALAKSFIIDGDDDLVSLDFDRDNDLSLDALDISAQLREFDTALPTFHREFIRPSARTVKNVVSLDEALDSLAEPAISLEALVPIASITAEDVAQSVQEDLEEASPWVCGRDEQESESSAKTGSLWSSRFFHFEWRVFQHASFRALAAFTALSFVVVLPLHAMQSLSGDVQSVSQIQAVGSAALDDVARATAALSAQDFGAAESNFISAAAKFSDAENTLKDIHSGVVALVNVIPETNRTLASVRGLITAGQELSQTASIMSQAGKGLTTGQSTDIVAKLEVLSAYVESALPHAIAAGAALKNVDPSVVPAGYLEKVTLLQSQVPSVISSMEEYLQLVDTFVYLLGGDSTMRYLALFQNNTELRPTGGFVGSFAEVDIDNGEIKNLSLPGGGTYDVQGQLNEFVEAPQPLTLIAPRWEFQDGNWFPDFPTSAKKMQWFYEHAGGPTTDGVMAVNATFIEKLLVVIGEIEIPSYGVTIDAENFLFMTEKIVEVDNGTTSTPKAFLGDLAPLLLEKVQSADTETLLRVIAVVERGLAERDIQVYFRDNDAQRAMHDLGYDGAIAQTDGDYLMVVNTNIGGGKTDAVIDQTIDVTVDIAESGSIIDTVAITKTHRGMANALFTGKNNVDYIRLYVPEGSVLLSAEGFEPPSATLFERSDVPLTEDEDLSLIMSGKTRDALTGVDIWNEFGKTVFGGWIQTAPGEVETVKFSYRVPSVLFESDTDRSFAAQVRRTLGFDNHDGYSLFVQKQSGVVSRTTTVHVNIPSIYQTLWTNVVESNNKLIVIDNARDSFSGWVFTR